MNRVELTGRFTRDPEVRYSNGENQKAIANFYFAVDRRFKREGEPTADFISCVAFSKTAEFIEKYFRQGMKAGICGRIQTGKYKNKEGVDVYTTQVVVEEIEFGEKKAQDGLPSETPTGDGFMSIPDGIDEETPFS